MLNIGCHLSCSRGYLNMGKEAVEIGANTFQYFSRNPRGSSARAIDVSDLQSLIEFMKKNGFAQIIAHASYTMNPCAIQRHMREYTKNIVAEDLKTLEYLPGNLYNLHPGNHMGQGAEEGIKLVAELLNSVISADQNTTVLIEGMSGKGTEIGSSFEELKQILERVEISDKVGICLDTCHLYSSGHDIVKNLDGVLEEFDSMIGLERLKAMHLNDSMTPFDSRKDRHQKIGEGLIGAEAIIAIINHNKLKHLPFILETPNEQIGFANEIKLLRSSYKDS